MQQIVGQKVHIWSIFGRMGAAERFGINFLWFKMGLENTDEK